MHMTSKSTGTLVGSICGIAVALAFSVSAHAQTQLILSHHVPTTHVIHQTAEQFAQLVEEGTDGEVTVEIRPAAQMFGMPQAVEALDLGTLDFAWGNISALQRWAPAVGFVSMPFLFEDGEHARRVLYGELGEQVRNDVMALSGVDILAFGNAGFRVFVANQPIATAADVAGLRLRVPNISAYVDMAEALGANPTPLPAAEVYTALQTGVIDGMESPADYFTSVSIWEVVDHATRTNHIFTAGGLMASELTMQGLSDEHQAIIREAAVEAVGQWMWSLVEETQNTAWARLAEEMQVIGDPDIESFRDATAGVLDAFIADAGDPAAAYVNAVRDAQ